MTSTTDQQFLIKGFQDFIENLKTAHADEIFELQKCVSKLQDRDTLLTRERATAILTTLGATPGVHVWILPNGQKISICACRGEFARVKGIAKKDALDMVWLGTNVNDTDIFTNANIPIGEFTESKRINPGNSGRFYTTEPVYESTLRQIIAELEK